MDFNNELSNKSKIQSKTYTSFFLFVFQLVRVFFCTRVLLVIYIKLIIAQVKVNILYQMQT